MTKLFHTDGTSISSLKRRAKERARDIGQKLSAAQQAIARELGVEGFSELIASAIIIEEDVLSFSRVVDGIEHIFDYADIADNLQDAFDAETGLMNDLWIIWSVEYGEHRPIFLNRFECREPLNDILGTWKKFTPKDRIRAADFISALDKMDEGKNESMVRLLGQMGVYTHGLVPERLFGEHEGLLQIILREQGLNVGDRALTQLDLPEIDGKGHRLFVNKLSDGSYVACNGSSFMSDLCWRVLSAQDFEKLKVGEADTQHMYEFTRDFPPFFA